jgi:5-methylcytosine-specific restriction endonuclease McrA
LKRKKFVVEEREGIRGKECSMCSEWKPLTEFRKHVGRIGDTLSYCKICGPILARRYREKNKEKVRARERERNQERKEKQKIWRGNNKFKLLLNKHLRKARTKNLPATMTEEDFVRTLSTFEYKCAITGSEEVTVDHVIPLSLGVGGTIKGNIIPLRLDLNSSKYNKNIFEWFEECSEKFNLDKNNFDKTIHFLANESNMTASEYRDFIYETFERYHL